MFFCRRGDEHFLQGGKSLPHDTRSDVGQCSSASTRQLAADMNHPFTMNCIKDTIYKESLDRGPREDYPARG